MSRPYHPNPIPLPRYDPAQFNLTLRDGQAIRVRWTYKGHAYDAHGVIAKLNPTLVVVRLAQDIEGPLTAEGLTEFFPRGTLIKVDRHGYARWGQNHCVVPLHDAL